MGARIRTDGVNHCEQEEAQVSWLLERGIKEQKKVRGKMYRRGSREFRAPELSYSFSHTDVFLLSHVKTGGAFTQLAPFLIALLVEAVADLAVKSLDNQL